jgi:long-chain acyl-CoA synthetase
MMPTATHGTQDEAFRRLSDRLVQRLAFDDDAVLAELSDGPLTRRDLGTAVAAIQAQLQALGVTAGDRIAVFSGTDRTVIQCLVAALCAGIATIVGDPRARAGEIQTLIETSRPAVVIIDDGILTAAGEIADAARTRVVPTATLARSSGHGGPAPDGPRVPYGTAPQAAVMVFTSGTTSDAKVVELTYANLLAQFAIFEQVYGFDADSRLLNLLPLHHVDGLIRGPLTALWFGATVYRRSAFSVQAVPTMLASLAEDRITHFVTVPAMLRIVDRIARDTPEAFSTPDFRFILSSADLLDAGLWRRVEERYGVPVVNAYGLSEVVCDALFAGPEEDTRIIGTIGRAVGVEARIVDDAGRPVADGETGELTIAGPTVMRGYFGAPHLTAPVLRDGVFHTGDLMQRTPDGLFVFVGRKKTAVVSAGVTIHPESVTEVLSAFPGVAEAHTIGVTDPDRGERLVAAIAAEPEVALSLDQVWAHCRAHIAPERLPSEIIMVEALPRGDSGKVNLAALRDRVTATGAPAGAEETVFTIAARCFNVPVETLSEESTPFNTPGWDSLAHITFIETLEEVYDMTVSPEEIAGLMCLGDAVAIVADRPPAR